MEWQAVVVAAIGVIGILLTQWITSRREFKRLSFEQDSSRFLFLLERRIAAYSDFLACLSAAGSTRYQIMKSRVQDGKYESSDPSDVWARHAETNALMRAYNMVCLIGSEKAVLLALDLLRTFEDSKTRDFESWYERVDVLGKKFAATIRIEMDSNLRSS